ncbi:MAG: hypothetical protein H0V63_00955 [Burkholderiaceae bacterium]|nr:hypothetical protein [Burkholderiaceae bacterium]
MRFSRTAARLMPILLARYCDGREPDFVVGHDNPDGPYLLRWYVTPWRGWYRDVAPEQRTRWQRFAVRISRLLPNLYVHRFLRDDDDRALHDHPSWAVSFMLRGSYIEHTIAYGGIHHRRQYDRGTLRFLRTFHTHRIELLKDAVWDWHHQMVVRKPIPCWSLFLFGPTVREWGFHCPERGWVPWQEFTAADKPGEVGKGCGA